MAELLSWHRVGQKVAVACDVHPFYLVLSGLDWLRKGTECTITAVKIDADMWDFGAGDGDNPVWLKVDRSDRWFGHVNFQPIHETSIEQFRALLSPTDADHERLIRETADAADRERADA